MSGSADHPDSRVETVSWIENILYKCEVVYLEVKEDTRKFVQSQVETVGASVKKFYEEVMQDLILEPLSEESASSIRDNRESVSIAQDIEPDIPETSNRTCKDMSDSTCDTTLSDELAEHKQQLSDCPNETTLENSDNLPDISSSTDFAPFESPRLLVEGNSSSDGLSTESSEGTHINDDSAQQTDSEGNTNTISRESGEKSELFNTNVVDKCDVIDEEVEIVGLIDELRLPQQLSKRNSYKKKILEAFSSKKRSTKWEYEHLSAQHEEALSSSNEEQQVVPALVVPDSDFLDSEWELI
ncbi:unnamed protein product [Cuscuta campestris]|uniref:Uncharacterized protein n=1 Tax=Cuscuta campestris TaxID=132261 RepID=A0A484MGS2_9ASTE|nr:unnamed protein product [Cuscuta campestris]